MKYKVGDKVKVRQDLVDNSAYGAHKWYFGMNCKCIVINRVWDNCYVAHNYGTNWYYTDEMLDGLADEPEEELKKPTNAELIQAAKMLFEHCNKRAVNDDCSGCPFDNVSSDGYCGLGTPCDDWCLPHIKTRKDVMLEKFPNADIDDITNYICPCKFGLGRHDMIFDCDHNCDRCWDEPAESGRTVSRNEQI